MSDEKRLIAGNYSAQGDAVANSSSGSAGLLYWIVTAEVGGNSRELLLSADELIESKHDDNGPFWSVHRQRDGEPDARFHADKCALPAGWYELTGCIACLGGSITLPTVSYGHSEELQLVLPAPDARGRICALLLFYTPVLRIDFVPSIEAANFRLHDFCLRRMSRTTALGHMLGKAEKGERAGRRLRSFARFAMHAGTMGMSRAAGVLYENYLQRLRDQALDTYKARSREATALDADKMADGRSETDETLTPYVIDRTHVQGGSAAIASEARRLEREIRLLADSGLFDARYYLRNNPDVARARLDPLRHFCQNGWQHLRNPSAQFDVWWYWVNHLDPSREWINPLVHHALRGRQEGLSQRPPGEPHLGIGQSFVASTDIRRICLFAGYDVDGIIDDCVVDYLYELSRHADVYYLADAVLRPGELDKLSDCTRGSWAIRHGAYDFGSYAMLARDLVGWDTIEQYDELIFANDSAWLLRALDDVFVRMDTRACDWWGLQATKGMAATHEKASNRFDRPIAMERVKSELLAAYEKEYIYDFHVGSYFMAFRAPVIRDKMFRKLINSVRPQCGKLHIIRKYEIGITHQLIGSGYAFDTYIDSLYPFHPVYTEHVFELVRQGFPLFKRYYLAQNHYQTPHLADWKERLRQWVPDAPVEKMEQHLLRVSDYEVLYAGLRLEEGRRGQAEPYALLGKDAFAKADATCEKHDDWWVFPACAFTQDFSGNERAIFETVKHDASIKKIVLTRQRYIDVDGENVVVVPLNSKEGQNYLMRARQIFIKHSPTRNLVYPVSPARHNLINVWHGIPLKRIGYASLDMQDKLDALAKEHAKCRAVISSSKVDTMAMASAFYPLSYNDVWNTGLPRNDFILRGADALPDDFREQARRLEAMLEGRHLVLFMPTFKQAQAGGYYRFSEQELKRLKQWLERHGAVLGIREHMADRAHSYFSMLSRIGAMDLGNRWFPNVEVLYRQADLLITDYSSCFVDFMLTGKPMLSFAYDYDNYAYRERGLFYDLDDIFPGEVCRNFEQLAAALDMVTLGGETKPSVSYRWKRKLFFDHLDDGNADRVVKRVKALYTNPEAPHGDRS